MGEPDDVEVLADGLRASGIPVVVATPEEVADTIVDAIERETFWAHPTVEDDERLAGGRQREVIEWENEPTVGGARPSSSDPRPTPISGGRAT